MNGEMADSGSFYTKSGEELIRYVHFNIYLSASVSHRNLIDLNINYTGVDINLMPICQAKEEKLQIFLGHCYSKRLTSRALTCTSTGGIFSTVMVKDGQCIFQ